MNQLISSIPLIVMLILSKMLNRSFSSPSGVFSSIWIIFFVTGAFFAPNYKFSLEAGIIIDILIASFFLGEVLVNFFSYRYFSSKAYIPMYHVYNIKFERRLLYAIKLLGLVSIIGAVLYFYTFLKHFGSFVQLFTAGWLIREEIGKGLIQVPLLVRVMTLLGYSGISLSLVYWMRYRFKWVLIIPFISLLIMGITQAARAGTFMILIWAFIASYWRDKVNGVSNVELRMCKRVLFFSITMIIIFLLGLMYREQNFTIESIDDRQLKICRSYAYGAISAFSVFWDNYSFGNPLYWGLYSFSSLFELLGIKKLAFGFYDEYLVVSDDMSEYTNVFTIFRSLIDDFGVIGSLLYMLILGALMSFAYKLAIRNNLSAVSFVCIMYTLLVYSVIAPLTQHNSIILAFILPPLIIKYLSIKSNPNKSLKKLRLSNGKI